jgi:hypothetical protein
MEVCLDNWTLAAHRRAAEVYSFVTKIGQKPRIESRNACQDLAGAVFFDRKMAESVRVAFSRAFGTSLFVPTVINL